MADFSLIIVLFYQASMLQPTNPQNNNYLSL